VRADGLKACVTVLFAVGAVALGTACSAPDESAANEPVALAAVEQLPPQIQEAPATVRQAYQFAAANPAILERVPCYCGCGSVGHTSVHSCYVASGRSVEPIRYDGHALGCSICVDIALDALRLTREGMSPDQIRAYVDRNYSRFGTSNMQRPMATLHRR
jgi:hypothetical protein